MYPTVVERLAGSDLWVKRDDATHPLYGGNKVRKLDHILADATRDGARRLLTFGAAGSHHVLATTLHGRAAGFDVAALLTPMPFHEHAETNLRWALQAGLVAIPCPHTALLPLFLMKARRRGDAVIPPGGSSVAGALGYADAARELETQVRTGEIPEPDVVVAALGSGGTVAGLVAGLEATSLRCEVHAVRVVPWPMMNSMQVLLLARAAAKRRGTKTSMASLRRRMHMISDRIGPGYGHPTPWGSEAITRAADAGLELEPTYTAKAFAHALRLIDKGHHRNVLYWHTLSGTKPPPLTALIPPQLQRLWIPS